MGGETGDLLKWKKNKHKANDFGLLVYSFYM